MTTTPSNKLPGTRIIQGFSWFIDGMVLTVTTGRDGTERKHRRQKWNRCPVPSTISRTVNSYRPVPSRKHLPLQFAVPSRRANIPLPFRTYPYRPVPSSKPVHTVPSRHQNLSLPSNPAVKTCPYRLVPPFTAVTPSSQNAVNTMNTTVLIVLIANTYFICPPKMSGDGSLGL